MPKSPSLPPLAELLRKSREMRIRLLMHSDLAAKLKESVEHARQRMSAKSLFSPE